MLRGVAIAFATYAIYSCADASIKTAGSRLHVVQMTFMASIFSCMVVFFIKPKAESWLDMLRARRPGLVWLRALSAVGGSLLSAYAFTHLPLADVYSLLFLFPMFVAVLSVLTLGESLTWPRIVALSIGFVGVMFVVRPGFREILPGHFAAIACAVLGAVGLLVLRKIARTERQVTLIGSMMLCTVLVTGVSTFFVFQWPTLKETVFLALCGGLGGLGHLGLMAATRHAPANRVAPVQYSQIIWAVVLGSIFFGEIPDWIGLIGMALVALSGVMNFVREGRPAGTRAAPAAAS